MTPENRRKRGENVGECIDLAAQIATGKAPGCADNRRMHQRHGYNMDVPIVWLGPVQKSDDIASIRVSDISVGGLRLVGRHMLYPGSFGVVQLTRTNGSLALVGITVLHTSYIGNMRYASGCRFTPIPQEHANRFFREGELVPLVPGQPLPSPIDDLRAA